MKTGKIKTLICAVLCCVLLLSVTLICLNANAVYAAPQDYAPEITEDDTTEIEPRWTSLSLSIDCGDGKVWATAKNDFTLISSKVVVIVLLYSSTTYTESYLDMYMESNNETSDLDMGKTITTEASTGGVEKYWIARMRYKINGGDWKTKEMGPYRISGSGEFLGYV
ncbi:MAG: hypothetical protein K2O44_06330 [Clostridia bacterium]|nr:hypothetical protein [Clostridia bacterium]